MIEVDQACTFSGHRPQKLPWRYDETAPACIALKEVLTDQIARLVNNGNIHFLSGMAEAVDTWSAEIVLALREKNPALKLHCILPCITQAEQWSVSSRERYFRILDQADSIIRVSRTYHKNCMLQRNHFMIHHSSTLLAVYNGEYRGGTASTVRYARKMGREILVIDPVTLRITHEKMAVIPQNSKNF